MFNEKQLEYFVKTAQTGNITTAARQLFISQPALSRVIRDLETEAGAELFIRRQSGVTLTQAGQVYLTCCQAMLERHQEALREIQDMRDSQKGQIRLGLSAISGQYLLPQILETFRAKYPKVELLLTETQVRKLDAALLRGEIELALTYFTDVPELAYTKILTDKIYLEAPPSFPTNKKHRGTVPGVLSDLRFLEGAPMILLKPGRGMRKMADALCEKWQVTPKVILKTDSIELAHKLVLHNAGFTFVPGIALPSLDREQPAYFYDFAPQSLTRTLYLAHRPALYLTKAMQDLIALLQTAALPLQA